MTRLLAVLFALLLQTFDACAEHPQFEDRGGDVYEIRLESVSETSGDGTSGSSRSVTTLVERVVALRDDGVELEFDLPEQTSAQDRARDWQFPARTLKSPERSLQLLNEAELEVRLRAWLQRGGMTQVACGRWIFTWTAIKIECEPKSVLQVLGPFDLRLSNLRDGAFYGEPLARGVAPLRRDPLSSGGATFAAEMEVDPDVVRRERAESDVAVAQMTGQAPLAFEGALQARATERITGTIETTIETDSAGRVTRRTQITHVEITAESIAGAPDHHCDS